MLVQTKKYDNIKFKKQPDGEFTIDNPDVTGTYVEKVRAKIQPEPVNTLDPNIKWNNYTYTWNIQNNVFSGNDPRLICRQTVKNGITFTDPGCSATDIDRNSRKITKLGDFILTTVDNIRMINPTTNNPVSSRSHVLIYIKIPFLNTNGTVSTTDFKYLIFGDLAGVENKFTCDQPNTQAQFLGLPEYDRITGEPIDHGKDTNGDKIMVPHYTINSRLSLKKLPNDTNSKLVLDFFGYNPDTKTVSDENDLMYKLNLLGILSGLMSYIDQGNQFVDVIKRFFNAQYAQVNKFETNFRKIDAFLQGNNILKTNKSDDSYFIPTSTNRDITFEFFKSIMDRVDYNNDYTKLVGPKHSVNNDDLAIALSHKLNDPIDPVRVIFDGYLLWKQTQSNAGQQNLSDDRVNELITTGMTEAQFNKMPNLKQKILDKIAQSFDIKFSTLIKNAPTYKTLIFGAGDAGLYKDLIENIALLKSSNVKTFCDDRKNEGEYINRALIGMSKDLSSLIQQLSSNSDLGLFKNIPLVKEACFKYFCNQDHQSCFSQLEKNKDEDYNKSIIDDIKDILDPPTANPRKFDNTNKLGIIVFAVLNINKDANDPSRIPYVDITKLKQIRDEYITYKFYYQDSDPIEGFKQSINSLFGNNDSEGMWKILVEFKNKIGPLSLEPIRIKKLIETSNVTNFFDNLKNLIESIDMINSLSVIGTMDFLNSLKNIYSTDIACSLIKDDTSQNKIPDSFDTVKSYKNVMTGESLTSTITQQANDFKGNSGDIRSVNLPIGPAYDVTAINTIDKILGGYMKKSKKNNKNR